jgi:hypothetical protein
MLDCYKSCYLPLPEKYFLERYRIFGGVARFVFHRDFNLKVPKKMAAAVHEHHSHRRYLIKQFKEDGCGTF